jgi:hypothetical protein
MAPSETPFDSIESAYEYVGLLREAVTESRAAIQEDLVAAQSQEAARLVEALQLVAFKLDKLGEHMEASHRLLNDLRTLRRLLLTDRTGATDRRAAGADDPDWSGGA